MSRREFDNTEYNRLKGNGYQFIEIQATGEEIETSEDYFRKVVMLVPHKKMPATTNHYVIEINDSEVKDLIQGTDTDIFYIER